MDELSKIKIERPIPDSMAHDYMKVLSILAERTDHPDQTNGVSIPRSIKAAELVGPCDMRFYVDNLGSQWCEFTWIDKSSITIGLGDEQ